MTEVNVLVIVWVKDKDNENVVVLSQRSDASHKGEYLNTFYN